MANQTEDDDAELIGSNKSSQLISLHDACQAQGYTDDQAAAVVLGLQRTMDGLALSKKDRASLAELMLMTVLGGVWTLERFTEFQRIVPVSKPLFLTAIGMSSDELARAFQRGMMGVSPPVMAEWMRLLTDAHPEKPSK